MLLVTSNTATYQITIEFDHDSSTNTSTLNQTLLTIDQIYNNQGNNLVAKRIEVLRDYFILEYNNSNTYQSIVTVYALSKTVTPYRAQPPLWKMMGGITYNTRDNLEFEHIPYGLYIDSNNNV